MECIRTIDATEVTNREGGYFFQEAVWRRLLIFTIRRLRRNDGPLGALYTAFIYLLDKRSGSGRSQCRANTAVTLHGT